MITLYFIRHGETYWNASGRYQGSTDVALSPEGICQASLVTKRFLDIPLDGVVSSPLKRAVDTAQGIADSHSLELKTDSHFSELCFGDWEGKTFSEIEERWPGMIDAMYHYPETIRFPNGESFVDAQTRAMKGINRLLSGNEDKAYAIVCHGAIMRTLFCGLLDIPLIRAWNFCVFNASVSCLRCYPGDRNLLTYSNSTYHLET
ncbi:MAG: histidine phosphatase family protein [Dialister sp.]|nr:histidine phosphatase family protein [Dialister sp.]